MPQAVPKPSAPTVTCINSSSLEVSWEAPTSRHIDKYSIQVHDGWACFFFDSAQKTLVQNGGTAIDSNIRSIVVSGLPGGAICKAKLAVKISGEWSGFSAYSRSLLLGIPTPATPMITVINSSTMEVSWDAIVTAGQVENYSIWVHDGSEKVYDSARKSLVQSGGTAIVGSARSIVIAGLSNGAACKAKLAVKIAGEWSGFSAYSRSSLLCIPAPATPMITVINSSTMEVSWEATVTAGQVENYSIKVHDGSEKVYDSATKSLVQSGGTAIDGSARSIVIAGLSNGAACKAKLAVNISGEWSGFSAYSRRSLLCIPTPATPVITVVNSSTMQVSWDAIVTAGQVENYSIRVHDGSEKVYDSATKTLVQSGGKAIDGSARSILIAGLSEGAACKAKLAVKIAGEWSEFSAYSQTSLLGVLAPLAPSVTVINSSSIRVSWEPPITAGQIDNYSIKVHDGLEWFYDSAQKILVQNGGKAIDGSIRSIVIQGLSKGVTCKAKVSVKICGEWSCFSAFSNSITLPTSRKRTRDLECNICLEREPDIAFDPCGHICCCSVCATSLGTCPLCRGHISKKLKVYF